MTRGGRLNTRINARGVIQDEGKVLLAHFVADGYFFFPGGGVEFGESAQAALKRELQEEMGAELVSSSFIGAAEHLFDNSGTPYHELNLLFSALVADHRIVSLEKHLLFEWMAVADLERENVLPKNLVAAVVRWARDGRTFWVSM